MTFVAALEPKPVWSKAPHSPDERVHVGSVGRFYRLLTATLA